MEKQENLIVGRLKSVFDTCVVLDAEVVRLREKVRENQYKAAQMKAEGKTAEDVKDLLVEAVVANTEASLIEQNLYSHMAIVSELKFLAGLSQIDLAESFNEEGLTTIQNIVRAIRPIYTSNSGEVVKSDEAMIDSILDTARTNASKEEILAENFKNIQIEQK